MHHVRLVCGRCPDDQAPDMKILECCGGPLDAAYTGQGGTLSVAGYEVAMPFSDAASMPTLGEGDTPVVRLAELGGSLGLERLDAKLEYMNPTGSYKDRGTVVMLAMAREQGVMEVAEDSSGNAGASVSAYAARAGIKAHIFAPATAPAAKLRQIRVYGAEVHSIEGPREAATEAAVAFCEERDMVYASHAWSPFFFEGTKTFAFETAGQYGGEPPAHIVFPVGNGGLFLGAWRGFNELLEAGHIDRIPRLHAVQAANVMPIAAGSWAAPGTRRACSRPWREAFRSRPRRAARRSSTWSEGPMGLWQPSRRTRFRRCSGPSPGTRAYSRSRLRRQPSRGSGG